MIPLNESSNLEFSLSIQNSSSPLDKATLFIEAGKFEIALPIILEGDKATVKVPALENILEAGDYGMRLEMVIGGVLFTPFKDNLKFNAPTKIVVEKTAEAAKVVQAGPSISVSAKVSKPNIIEEAAPVSKEFTDLLASLIKKST